MILRRFKERYTNTEPISGFQVVGDSVVVQAFWPIPPLHIDRMIKYKIVCLDSIECTLFSV